jgi:hypothetical protein
MLIVGSSLIGSTALFQSPKYAVYSAANCDAVCQLHQHLFVLQKADVNNR